jgi:hypothetical protein
MAGLVLIPALPTDVGYADWAAASGVADFASSDDPDGDGIINLLEYALGSHPAEPDTVNVTMSGRTVSYPKGPAALEGGDVIWRIEATASLQEDHWQTIVPDVDLPDRIAYSVPDDSALKFVRLAISRPLKSAALDYSGRTGLSGVALEEVSHLLHELADIGLELDLLVLLGDRYRARSGSRVEAVIGPHGTVEGAISREDRMSVFNGSSAWIEFVDPAASPALVDHTIFAVASADSATLQSLVVSSNGGTSLRGPRLMFNGSSSWGVMPGRVAADANNGTATGVSGWNTVYRVHSGKQLMPVATNYSAGLPASHLVISPSRPPDPFSPYQAGSPASPPAHRHSEQRSGMMRESSGLARI